MKKETLFYIFINPFNNWLERRQMDSQIFSFNLLYVLLWLKYMKSPFSLTDMELDRDKYFDILSDNCHFISDTTPELHKWQFLKTYL